MPRIPTIDERDAVPTEHRDVYDTIVRTRGPVIGPFALLLHSPEVAERTAALGAYLRFESELDARDRELAILAVAREMDCRYEWAAHAREARRAGVRDEAIAAIRDRRAPDGLHAGEAAVVGYVQELLRARRVSAGAFDGLRERLGVRGVVELTATAGYYVMLACTLNAFEMVPGPEDDLLPV